ncbi:hypothetical protein Scep_006205 [Stephania cephalantha]|uniref:Histone deacetylase complex subunit SAP30 Sin3 binding domain-containing protein n=1 Tax=Stephania cephalantha TaxID=152367 RepID=A0AAP0K7J7_9MAGN
MEHELCSPRFLSPFRDESGDEELSVLPRHTKVIVTGNNRTKSVLVGLQGVVKKAVGLGGWHWLVLKNGVEVKLQRNALSVLEPPTGNEEDDDEHEFNSCSSSDIGEKDNDFSSSEFHNHKASKPRVRHGKPLIFSNKQMGRPSFRDIQSNIHKPHPLPKVNLAKLGTPSLWRYCKRYNLVGHNYGPNPNTPKSQLVDIMQPHFLAQQKLDEFQVIMEFIGAAKRLKTMHN